MADDDTSIEQSILGNEGGTYPLISGALKQSDCRAWLSANGVDVEALRGRIEQPSG